MNDAEALTLIDVFSSPEGRKALTILENRARSLIRLDQRPVPPTPSIAATGSSTGNPGSPGTPNDAFLNPNAAMYRAGMTDQIFFIRRLIEKKERNYGYETITLDKIREDEERARLVQRSLDGEDV